MTLEVILNNDYVSYALDDAFMHHELTGAKTLTVQLGIGATDAEKELFQAIADFAMREFKELNA